MLQKQKKTESFCAYLGLHYLSLKQKTGCASDMQNKSKLSFCISLGLYYLCLTE